MFGTMSPPGVSGRNAQALRWEALGRSMTGPQNETLRGHGRPPYGGNCYE